MKRSWWGIGLFFFLLWWGYISGSSETSLPFAPGEKLLYDVKWLGIVGGKASIEVKELKDYQKKEVYQIYSRIRTVGPLSLILKVKDEIISLLDREKICSLRTEVHLREGRYRSDRVITYDQEKHKAFSGKKEFNIPPRVQDPFTSLFYLRTQTLTPGTKISIPVHTSGKNYTVEVKIQRKERIRIYDKRYKAILVEPVIKSVKLGTKAMEKMKYLKIWLTDDEKKIPLLIKTKVALGSLTAVLTNREGLEEKSSP